MARINVGKLGQVSDMFMQADLLSQATMVGWVFVWRGAVKLINKALSKTWFELGGLVVYLIAALLWLALPGFLHIQLPEYVTTINYVIIALGALSLVWIIYDLFRADDSESIDEEITEHEHKIEKKSKKIEEEVKHDIEKIEKDI